MKVIEMVKEAMNKYFKDIMENIKSWKKNCSRPANRNRTNKENIKWENSGKKIRSKTGIREASFTKRIKGMEEKKSQVLMIK